MPYIPLFAGSTSENAFRRNWLRSQIGRFSLKLHCRVGFVLALVLATFSSLLFTQTKPPETKKQEAPPAAQSNTKAKKPEPSKSSAEAKEKKTEEKKPGSMTAETFSGLQFRLIGPAVASGRVMSFAVNPKNRADYYVGVASGGVWKTSNAGTTWTPVFDGEGSYSIGTVVLDPNDASVVWVGAGESKSQRSVGYGRGGWRSRDGGKSWKNLGLKKSEHIGRIVIDPRDSKIVYVAAQGPLWGPGGDRGLYKTTDGGKTWKRVLYISENTGVTDVVIDPRRPDVLIAASYPRCLHVWKLIDGGLESGLHILTDC